ncbi:MAG: hypothetical protein WCV86_04280 [Patescibacteria group bacterium]|jgi:hypothetical protein
MSILGFLAVITPIFFSLYWLLLFFRMVRVGSKTQSVYLLSGVVLYGLSIIVVFAARAGIIQENASRGQLGTYLLETSFYSDSLVRLVPQYLAAVIGAAVLWLFLLGLRKISRRNFYDSQEAGMIAVGALMAGWPGVFVFLALLFFLVLLAGVMHVLLKQSQTSDRFVIGPMIPVAAIAVIWLGTLLLHVTGLDVIRF